MNMRNNKKIYIIYHPGSYGSYIRWIIEYCNDIGHRYKFIPKNPIAPDGSSHTMFTLPNAHPAGIDGILETLKEEVDELCGYKIYRACPSLAPPATDIVLQGLSNDKNQDVRIIYIDVDGIDSRIHCFLNLELKTPWDLSALGLHDRAKYWKENSSNFFELDRWQQREIISLNCFEMIESLTKCPDSINEEIMVIKMSEIIHSDIVDLAKKIINHCHLPLRSDYEARLCKARDSMLNAQRSFILYESILEIVDAVIRKRNIDIAPMTLFAEALVQRLLRDKGLELKCYGLNEFPKTTADLIDKII